MYLVIHACMSCVISVCTSFYMYVSRPLVLCLVCVVVISLFRGFVRSKCLLCREFVISLCADACRYLCISLCIVVRPSFL